jgi:hypothetical protein
MASNQLVASSDCATVYQNVNIFLDAELFNAAFLTNSVVQSLPWTFDT